MQRWIYDLLEGLLNMPDYLSSLNGRYAVLNDFGQMRHYAGFIRVRRRRFTWGVWLETTHVIDLIDMTSLPNHDLWIGAGRSVLKRVSSIVLYENEMDYQRRCWEYRLSKDVTREYDEALVDVTRRIHHGIDSEPHQSSDDSVGTAGR